MSTVNDGGAAFPAGDARGYQPSFGMTLRDYFAGQAAAGMAASSGAMGIPFSPEDIARRSYEVADAMLATRFQKGGEQ